jgi:hypothetical protein
MTRRACGILALSCAGLCVLLSSCVLPDAASLTTTANVELLVTGVEPGDRITVSLEGSTFRASAGAAATTSFFFTLAPGDHGGALAVARRGEALCASFTVHAPSAPARTTTSANLNDSARCDAHSDAGPDPVDAGDARVLVHFSEVRVGGCGTQVCTTRTDATSSGVVTVEDGVSAPVSGVASAASRNRLDAVALSPATDRLLQGDDPTCPRRGPPAGDHVTLSRTTEENGAATTETVDATACDTGIAAEVQAALAAMRADIGVR